MPTFRLFRLSGRRRSGWFELLLLCGLALTLTACGGATRTKPVPPGDQSPPEARLHLEDQYGEPGTPPAKSGKSYVVKGRRYHLLSTAAGYQAEGLGSWYGNKFHGRKTASGERFDQNKLTAAHTTLPFGSLVEVTNPKTNKSVVVRINDRGPFHPDYVIDLSRGAAQKIGLKSTTPVSVRAVSKP